VEDKGVLNFRIYWFTRLLCPLQKGAVYNITFYAGAIGSKFIPSNLGMYFSPTEVRQVRVQPLRQQPSIEFTEKNVTRIKGSEWLKVTAQYTATGDERYLVIGNFRMDADMVRHRKPNRQKVTYCVDDLSVKRQGDSTTCEPNAEVAAWLAYRIRHTPGLYQPPVVKKDTVVPAIKQPVRIDTLVLQDVLFKFDSGNLTSAASKVLDTIVLRLKKAPYKAIRIEGHTDSLGTEAYNIDLSTRRANAVLHYLTAKGLDAKDFSAIGKGELRPVATNSTDAGRRRNRRVEILIEY
jgi:outer membrane protein OmpA-like peptidoglycan-associated protein